MDIEHFEKPELELKVLSEIVTETVAVMQELQDNMSKENEELLKTMDNI